MQEKVCEICGITFTRPKGTSFKLWENRKCCSKDCRLKWMNKNKIGFQKGHKPYYVNPEKLKGRIPWNKGLKGRQSWHNTKGLIADGSYNRGRPMSEEQKKKISRSLKGKKILSTTNEKHWAWKGDDVGYDALHTWLTRHYKKEQCEFCGESDTLLDWANISDEYKRDRDDFLVLCRKCHIAFDKGKKMNY